MTNWKDNQNYCQIFVPPSPLSHSSEDISVLVKQRKKKFYIYIHLRKSVFRLTSLIPYKLKSILSTSQNLKGGSIRILLKKCVYFMENQIFLPLRDLYGLHLKYRISTVVLVYICSIWIGPKALVFCIWTRLYGMNLNRSGMGLGQTWTRAWQLEFF